MASEDWFLRLDPYNFNTQDEFDRFYNKSEENMEYKQALDEIEETVKIIKRINHNCLILKYCNKIQSIIDKVKEK